MQKLPKPKWVLAAGLTVVADSVLAAVADELRTCKPQEEPLSEPVAETVPSLTAAQDACYQYSVSAGPLCVPS